MAQKSSAMTSCKSITHRGVGRLCCNTLCIGAVQHCGYKGRMGAWKRSRPLLLSIPMPITTTEAKTEVFQVQKNHTSFACSVLSGPAGPMRAIQP